MGSRYVATLGTTAECQRARITLCGLTRDNSRVTTDTCNACTSNIQGGTSSGKGTGGHPCGRCIGGRPLALRGSYPRDQQGRACAPYAG
ncbi:hypothetical protein PanWU01x14_111840 [Parasponia andersonii]|uniref:Uncharacterized protein n=1 Tax=Parasponia andersonii TaxID=3476 RepID=A0A2P5CYL2_PARAD|nr:hypothetical protein PanWU01x14_111840 [Parasponia andersonii]